MRERLKISANLWHKKSVKLVPGVPKKYQRLIKNRTKVFCLIFRISFNLDKTHPILDFGIKTVEICWKLSEIYYFQVGDSKFYNPDFGDCGVLEIFRLVASFIMINYLSGQCSCRIIIYYQTLFCQIQSDILKNLGCVWRTFR